MRNRARFCAGLILVAGIGVAFCSVFAEEGRETAKHKDLSQLIEGGEDTLVSSFTGKVVAIDQEKRQATLELANGTLKKIVVTEAAYNFDRVTIGDIVKVDMQRYMQVFIGKKPDEPGAEASSFLDRAPKGQKPEGVAIAHRDVTATVRHIDRKKRGLTLRTSEGKTMVVNVPAGTGTDLNQIKKGDTVVLRYTTAMALKVRSP